ncbi:indolepyruvate ferredoxin oxidoreductase subunit alpha, partial [Candidatus Bathyarchaeota archaeon]|nr:indolepyruvate ferredoxin oxidoreductase subunit alpha [Candidatus Bathyarchaeota archaeon]
MSRRWIPPYALDEPGRQVLLLGNQAIARGFLEGGGQVASSYPGTPASEILETIADFAEMYGIYAEWADNERVAFEVCSGAAMCGLRTMCSMKHIGVNWAMDPLMHVVLRNPTGGFILVSGDDPSQHSSANEQDNRFLARAACIPCYEPSDPAEAKEMTVKLFEVSEAYRLPVMLRVTTRLCHVRGDVVLGPINMERRKGKMADDISWRKTPRLTGLERIPPHKPLHDKEERLREAAESLEWNRVEANGGERLGVIASGVSYNYAREA